MSQALRSTYSWGGDKERTAARKVSQPEKEVTIDQKAKPSRGEVGSDRRKDRMGHKVWKLTPLHSIL